MLNKTKLTGLLVLLLVVATVFAAGTASAASLYKITVDVDDENGNAFEPDRVVLSGPETVEWNPQNPDALEVPKFYVVNAGTYTATIYAQNYETYAINGIYVDDLVNDVEVYADLIVIEDTGEGDGQDGSGEGTTEPNMEIDFEIKPDDEVKPGDKITIEVELENNLGYKAEEVVVEATIFAIGDDGDDLEEETEEFTMSDDSEKPKELTFVIPYDAEEGEYNVKVIATWEDANEVEHNNFATDIVEIEKEKHDVNIINAYFGSESVEPGRTADMAVEIVNIGKNDEDVRIKVESPDLGVEEWSAQFELEEGETAIQYIPFSIPKDADTGKYFVSAVVTYNNGADSAVEYVTLTVDDNAVTGSAAVTLTPVVTTVSTEGDGATIGFEFTEDAFIIGGLIVGILVLLAIIAVVGKGMLPVRKTTVIESTRRRR